ncbi:rRNA accumulation- protein [Coemansia sp. RSA 2607]|nr:rRNA accumulation- protein [Coemansia sp. RSA 2607]KAJ2388652.1 rRNA accumulation- protein [Coemansia sp. RSA 2603]
MSTSAKPKIHPNKEAFIEGVDHVLEKWTALSLAVTNMWGGEKTKEKRDNMVDEIVEHFDGIAAKKKTPEATDLEDMLLDIMDEDFNISLEDQSEKEVAKILITIYNECRTGNFSTVDKLADERDAREARGAENTAVQKSQAGGNIVAVGEDSDSEFSATDEESDSDAMDED